MHVYGQANKREVDHPAIIHMHTHTHIYIIYICVRTG